MFKLVHELLNGSEVKENNVYEGRKSFGNFNKDINLILNSSLLNFGKASYKNSGESR